jgi:hypothetical protein
LIEERGNTKEHSLLPYLYNAKRFKNKWNPDQKNPFPIEIKKEKIKAETSKPHQSRRPVFGKQGSPGNENSHEYSPKAPACKVNTRYLAQDSFQVNPPTRKSGRKRKAQTQDEDKSDIEIIPAEPAESKSLTLRRTKMRHTLETPPRFRRSNSPRPKSR